MIEKCKKVLNVMRCLRGVDWGANRSALKTIYISLIRSVFDYGCVVYRSASKTLLTKLDVIQHKALRLCCGAMKSTPVNAMQVEMGEMPLHIRRDQLALVYWANLRGQKEGHISQPVLMHCQEKDKPGRSFGWVVPQKAEALGLQALTLCPAVTLSVIPPWLLQKPVIDLTLLELKNQGEFSRRSVEYHIREQYKDKLVIFTDASKAPDGKVGVHL